MNEIAKDIYSSIIVDGNVLSHYGVKYRSGRYPWGSGEDPYQNSCDFLGRREKLLKEGFTFTDENGKKWTGDNAIAKSLGMSSTEYRYEVSLANDERKIHRQKRIESLQADGLGSTEIGRRLGIPEGTVRSLMNEKTLSRTQQARATADFIKKQVDERGMIDVGKGAEHELNISKTKLDTALYLLQKEGYPVYSGGMDQVTMKGQRTTQKVICPPGTEHKAIYEYDKVNSLKEYISRDDGETYEKKFTYPASMDSKRLQICYKEQGGEQKDGIVELRRGVEDLSLGESRYAQVRILVDKTHYIKGMAVYSDDLPDGIDVRFNTNKKQGTPMKDVLKEIKNDPDNPFGSAIKDVEQGGQYWYVDKNGKKKLGLINKRADEGDWSDWKDTLPSQFLSKQSLHLAEKQLNLAKLDKQAEFDSICEITNPTIKKHLLQKFADECDAAAVDLKAAALPGQKYHAIIPINSLKDNEVYAPRYEDGTKLALVRYPHAGTFEIPILTVNNKHPEARKILDPDVMDAVGINSNVAKQLSGADFDGDTVMCIPTHDRGGKVKIKAERPLKELNDFDPKDYQYDEVKIDSDGNSHYYKNGREFRVMDERYKQIQMGVVSNLITDMTIFGAPPDEMAKAVKHSMVVIDAVKHKLDYRKSAIDNDIAYLHDRYQGHFDENGKYHNKGSATIISRASGPVDVTRRKGSPRVNLKDKPWYDPDRPEGALIFKDDPDATYQITRTNKKTGETVVETKVRTQKSTRMGETDDAHTLVSKVKYPIENVYADYANSMKAMANQARIEMANTGKIPYSKTAKQTYQAEYDSLMDKLRYAESNYIRERAAQRKANIEVENKKNAYKELNDEKMSGDDLKKISQQALSKYRNEVGTISRNERAIKITDREWEAIQAGAITETKLKQILNNADIKELRQRATPKAARTLSSNQMSRIKALSNSNYTLAQIAEKMGVSTSTVSKVLKGEV